jgi:glucose-6-phosphate 1-dehydrogenase
VVQNHLLQVVGLLAMEMPSRMSPASLRDEQVKVLQTIRPILPANLVRGQFRGYREEPGVARDSRVETFAAVRLEIESWRWKGVPFFIRAGKSLPLTATEVVVTLQPPPIDRVMPGNNYFRFRLGPDLSIHLGARVKKPGLETGSMPVELSAVKKPRQDEVDAYERLLTDAMKGEPMLFVREDAVEAAWSVVQPILGDAVPLIEYVPGSWGPAEAARLAAEAGGWINPQQSDRPQQLAA